MKIFHCHDCIVLYEPCVCLHGGSNPLENSLFVVMGNYLFRQIEMDGSLDLFGLTV